MIRNARRLCDGLMKRGYDIATGGTDVHLVLVDLRSKGLTGSRAEYVLEEVNIACNKNTVPGDKSAMNPSGIRLGTPALTTRGLVESDIDVVVEYIDTALQIAVEAVKISGPKLADFHTTVHQDKNIAAKVAALKEKVENFSAKFLLPGYDEI